MRIKLATINGFLMTFGIVLVVQYPTDPNNNPEPIVLELIKWTTYRDRIALKGKA